MKKTLSAIIPFVSLLLVSCSNTPTHLIVSPELMVAPKIQYLNKSAIISVEDMRTAQHIVQILHEDEAAELMNAQEALSLTVKQTLQKAMTQQGLTFTQQANNNINIVINKALISVDQSMMSYKASNAITLTVKVKNAEQTLTKTYSSTGSSNGPISADIAVLERDFNQQLSKLLMRIVMDNEIKFFIK